MVAENRSFLSARLPLFEWSSVRNSSIGSPLRLISYKPPTRTFRGLGKAHLLSRRRPCVSDCPSSSATSLASYFWVNELLGVALGSTNFGLSSAMTWLSTSSDIQSTLREDSVRSVSVAWANADSHVAHRDIGTMGSPGSWTLEGRRRFGWRSAYSVLFQTTRKVRAPVMGPLGSKHTAIAR